MVFTNSKLQIQTGTASAITKSKKRFWRHLGNRRSIYLSLAALLFCWNSSILFFTQQIGHLQVFNLLLWLGILISLEDQLPNLWPKPSPGSFFAGALILACLLSLSPWMFNEQDGYAKYLLLPIIIFALALLSRPVGNWQLFKNPLLISLLLPLSGAIGALSSPFLERLTALLAWSFLYGLGFQTTLSSEKVLLGSGGVHIGDACNGNEQLIFSVSMVVIFQLIFPLKNRWNILAAIIGAILSAVAINTLRIVILAYLTTWPNKISKPAFALAHGHGALLFSLVAAAIAGWIYLILLDREISA